MKEQINDQELEQVIGGTVIISRDNMNIGFNTSRHKYALKNCTYREARNFVEDLKDQNPNMNNAEFDAYVEQQLSDLDWI